MVDRRSPARPRARSQAEGEPVRPRRGKNPATIWIAAGVSVVLLIVAIVLFQKVNWDGNNLEDYANRRERAAAKKRKKNSKLAALVNKRDPYEDNLLKLITTLKNYEVDRFPLYIEKRAVYDFTMYEKKEKGRFGDLPMTEQFKFLDKLRQTPAFDGRWKMAKLGEWSRKNAGVAGYIDHDWVVVPRRFPGGEEDIVSLLVRREKNDLPRVRGYRYTVVKERPSATTAKDDLKVPEAVKKGASFKSLDTGLKSAPLPMTAKAGTVDEGGSVMAGVSKLPLIDGTSASVVRAVEGHLKTLLDPHATRKARQAVNELAMIGKPAIPILMNRLVGRDMKKQDDVFYCHQIIQALREISGQRFGFEPQVGEDILTAAAASEQKNALRRWFGWWKINGKTFEPKLSPQLTKELARRKRREEQLRK